MKHPIVSRSVLSTNGEKKRPLLEDAETSAIGNSIEFDALSENSSSAFEQPSLGFFDGYRPIGGVPAKIIRPSVQDSKFTCHRFSDDGSRLTTGETNGRIRLWRTTNYALFAEATDLFNDKVYLSFVSGSKDVVIATDRQLKVVEFKFTFTQEDEGTSTAQSGKWQAQTIRQWKLGNADEIGWCHFSEDGRTLACDTRGAIQVFRFTDLDVMMCSLETKENLAGTIAVSADGTSVLACLIANDMQPSSHRLPSVTLWPELNFSAQEQLAVPLSVDRALWGRKEEFLLTWNSDTDAPKLSVYRTTDLKDPTSMDRPMAQKQLDMGLANFKALMLDRRDDAIQILICEIGKSGKRRFLIWNVEKDAIDREVSMNIQPKRSVDMMQWDYRGKPAADVAECNLPVTSWEAYDCLVEEDACPKFCISRDASWIGAFSWRDHSCVVASTQSGAAVYSFSIPEDVMMNPFCYECNCQALFDPTGRHFVVISTHAIIACAPCFLNQSGALQMRSVNIPSAKLLDSLKDKPSLRSVFDTLSTRALAQAATIRLRHGLSDFGIKQVSKRYPDFGYVHMALSADGLHAALIGVDYNKASFRYEPDWQHVLIALTLDAAQDHQQRLTYEGVEAQIFPLDFRQFKPARIFLYPSKPTGSDSMVLFAEDQRPVALFCDIANRTAKAVPLEMQMCLRISQTQDRTRLVLLDTHCVHVLDLQQQKIVDTVLYLVNFDELFQVMKGHKKWPHERRFDGDLDIGRRISDSGQAVLLGWDTGRRRSLVIQPNSDPQTSNADILASANCLSDFCMLSRDGRCTLFIDVDDLSCGKITLAIFDEAAACVTHRIVVVESVSISRMTNIGERILLSCLSYDLSDDGTELLTYIGAKDETELQSLHLEEKIRIFGLYSTAGCVPSYECLTSQSGNTRASIKKWSLLSSPDISARWLRLFDSYGSGAVFNMPSRNGLSIFQEGFLRKNKQVIDSITALSQRQNFELAFEWMSPEQKLCNLLEASLAKNSTNDVKAAVGLIGASLIPFIKAATATKDAFKDILFRQPEIIKEALSSDALVIHTCQLTTHVSFFNPHLRQNKAVHLETTDYFTKWTLSNDPGDLEKLWRAVNSETVKEMEADGNMSTAPAVLKFVCMEDAAKVGMRGILRPLLFQDMPESIFKSNVVKWVVLYKWLKIWKQKFLRHAAFYATFLVCLVVYVSFIASSARLSDESLAKVILVSGLLLLLFGFGIRMLHEEVSQIQTFMNDGLEYFKDRSWGLGYFFRSRWNLVDLGSCLLLLVLIPFFHIAALWRAWSDDWLSAVVGIEAVLASIKVWYFAQPFRRTGALVLMIENIVKDCFEFLVLAFFVLFGFALALHVLFRSVPGASLDGEVREAFGSFQRSLVTLFYALLGAFEPEIFRAGGALSPVITATFSLYMIAQTVVLLNLLIAIMGDTFDRVKSTEEAQMLMGRAKFIDACEAALSEAEKEAMDKQTGKYLHVIDSADDASDQDRSVQWLGKLKMLEESFRRDIRNCQQKVTDTSTYMNNKMDDMAANLQSQIEQTTQRVANLEEQLSEQVQDLKAKITESANDTAKQFEKLFSHLQSLS